MAAGRSNDAPKRPGDQDSDNDVLPPHGLDIISATIAGRAWVIHVGQSCINARYWPLRVCDVTDVFARLRDWLDREGVVYRHVQHAPTRTSEESAQARGEELRVGGKALLLRVDDSFRLFVLSAARKLDSTAIRRRFNARHTRFATPTELLERTGLVPGSVPPFGEPLLPFELYADPSALENDRIAFNAGSLTDSIVMAVVDYKRLASPVAFAFSLPA